MKASSTAVDRIANFLSHNQRYKRMIGGFRLGDIHISFTFDAALVGPAAEDDLILIEDGARTPVSSLVRHVQALHAALSRVGSVRSLSLILVDGGDDDGNVEQLRMLTRVVEVSHSSILTDDGLREALAILLPLPVIGSTTTPPNGETLFVERFAPALPQDMQSLITFWDDSPEHLERRFLRILDGIARKDGSTHD